MATLLDDIEAHLAQHQTSATAFGDDALGDRHFVHQLRRGRRVWPETEEKVRRFMETRLPPTAVAMCSKCELRAEDPHVFCCTETDCPMARSTAAEMERQAA